MPNKNTSFDSMVRRLGLKNFQHPNSDPLYKNLIIPGKKKQVDGSNITGIDNQKMRLGMMGGVAQQERMIYDRRRGLDRALIYSFQSASVQNLKHDETFRALINPDKLKQDYDDKIIAIPYETDYQTGDVFEWKGTGTYWLIYLQNLTELAYFRGEIRRCKHKIKWKDKDGKEHWTYAAVRGPVETKIDFIQKHSISVDESNYSLNILMPLNEDTKAFFKRYAHFYLDGDDTCWRIEATDWISMPNILEINAVEDYADPQKDTDFVVDKLIVPPEEPNTIFDNAAITGETFIKPLGEYEYTALRSINGQWGVDSRYPITLTINKDNPKKCKVKWEKALSGEFKLTYGAYSKTIVVESLF